MSTDESGAPWPYKEIEPGEEGSSRPTWECPGGACQCHAPVGETERTPHRILFFDGGARRMPGARCRVLENGVLLNKSSPFADGSGGLDIEVRPDTRVLDLEWVPPSLPLGPGYPYRKRYYLNLGEARDDGVHRRLHNLGFSHHRTLEDNIREMQRTYLQPETGRPQDVAAQLAAFHDDGVLPPIPPSSPSGTVAPASSVAARGRTHALKDAPTGSSPFAGPAPAGGMKPQGSATAVQITKLRIQVRTRAGRGIEDAEVHVDVGPVTKTLKTDRKGFTLWFMFTRDEIEAGRGQLVVRSAKKHHGPDPTGIDKVVPGERRTTVTVGTSGLDPATPGLESDAHGAYLVHVLMDAGMNRGALANTITRRLSDDEIQKELIFSHQLGSIVLAPGSEFVFDHDPASGMFDPCTAKCTLRSPKPDQRVSLKTSKVGAVTLYLLESTVPSAFSAKDILPGQRFTRDTFGWSKRPLQALDQRHVAGLVRLCRELHREHGIVALYHIGVNGDTSRPDCHGYGLAIDFGGCGTELPPEGAKSMRVRLGVDFLIFLHWGNVPMWDPVTVAKDPGNSSSWKRHPKVDRHDRTDYTQDPAATKIKLHYSLDPAPFQEPVPPGTDPALATELDKIAFHFQMARSVFLDVYKFAVKEYSDDNSILGPSTVAETPTPIDSHRGHFILHPDYPRPNDLKLDDAGQKTPDPTQPNGFKEKVNGRGAHVNHFHFQLGPTNYKDQNGKPLPRTT